MYIYLYIYIKYKYIYRCICLKSASTNKLHLLNFCITVKERMADEVEWEATSSGQTTLFFFSFINLNVKNPHLIIPSQKKSKASLMSLPVPVLSSCQSESGT